MVYFWLYGQFMQVINWAFQPCSSVWQFQTQVGRRFQRCHTRISAISFSLLVFSVPPLNWTTSNHVKHSDMTCIPYINGRNTHLICERRKYRGKVAELTWPMMKPRRCRLRTCSMDGGLVQGSDALLGICNLAPHLLTSRGLITYTTLSPVRRPRVTVWQDAILCIQTVSGMAVMDEARHATEAGL